MGSPVFEDFVPQDNAACVDALEHAGAFVQGKTVSTEFATQHPGVTRNPWDIHRTPGGSSSGSAAAVAAGFTCAALGTQTRGSIVRPAAYCGVVGYKPSFGLVSLAGVLALSETLDHVGVLARCVDDAGLLASVLVDAARADSAAHDVAALSAAMRSMEPLPEPPRLAAVRTPAWALAEPAQQAAFDAQCALLGRAAGRDIPLVELPARFARNAEITSTIQEVEIARNFQDVKRRSGHLFSASFQALCERGEAISRAAYEDALGARGELCKDLQGFLSEWDAIVTPSAVGEAPQGLQKTGDPAFCTPWTLCGVPAVSIPSGLGPSGMPLALQLVGRMHDDARVLRVAAWCAGQLSFPRHSLPLT